MKKIFLFSLSVLFLCFANGQAAQKPSGNPDPLAILSSSESAMEKIQDISYRARHEYLGERGAVWPTIAGEVQLSHLPENNPFKARITLSGCTFQRMTDTPIEMKASFDGRMIRTLKNNDHVITETSFIREDGGIAELSLLIGGNLGRLIVWDFINPEFREPSRIQYDGRVSVEGVLCDVLYLEWEYEHYDRKRLIRNRWYIATEDRLPRRLESYSFRDDQIGAEALTLSHLTTEKIRGDTAFTMEIPSGFTLERKIYGVPHKTDALLPVGQKAPGWELEDPEGRTHSLEKYHGKIVMLDFWATWCGPCKLLMPLLQKIHQNFKEQDVVLIGIDMPSGVLGETAKATPYMKKMGYSYTLLLHGDDVAKSYGADVLPTLYILGTDGTIIYRSIGLRGIDTGLETSRQLEEYYNKLVKILQDYRQRQSFIPH